MHSNFINHDSAKMQLITYEIRVQKQRVNSPIHLIFYNVYSKGRYAMLRSFKFVSAKYVAASFTEF